MRVFVCFFVFLNSSALQTRGTESGLLGFLSHVRYFNISKYSVTLGVLYTKYIASFLILFPIHFVFGDTEINKMKLNNNEKGL